MYFSFRLPRRKELWRYSWYKNKKYKRRCCHHHNHHDFWSLELALLLKMRKFSYFPILIGDENSNEKNHNQVKDDEPPVERGSSPAWPYCQGLYHHQRWYHIMIIMMMIRNDGKWQERLEEAALAKSTRGSTLSPRSRSASSSSSSWSFLWLPSWSSYHLATFIPI